MDHDESAARIDALMGMLRTYADQQVRRGRLRVLVNAEVRQMIATVLAENIQEHGHALCAGAARRLRLSLTADEISTWLPPELRREAGGTT